MVLCVTGPMASGKNFVCSLLEEKGFVSIDADIVGHQAAENSKGKILETFGKLAEEQNLNLLNPDNTLNRKAVGQIIFASPELVKKQEDIVYPEINRILEEFIQSNKDKNVIINATVLFKIPVIKQVDKVLFIDCFKIKRFFRAKKRDGMKTKQILQRFKAQKNLFSKYQKSNADTVRVWNVGSKKSIEKKLVKYLSQ